jgi:hypothetical protein
MPLITTQSAKGYGWGARVAAGATNSFESIATATVTSGGSGGNVVFSSIPQTYKHLRIHILSGGTSGFNNGINMFINSDFTNANYWCNAMGTNGTSAYDDGPTQLPYIGIFGGNNGNLSSYICDVLNYSTTNRKKITRTMGGYIDPSGGYLYNYSMAPITSTNAITSIAFQGGGVIDFREDCRIALYGIKG